ncbi:MAG: serine/threonine-protein kinase [Anaerolineales bacterium]|nr:serine/threonine-protein kinase [Anaerolineales bacterium]
MTLERGTLLHKRYRIVEILGQGGMGSVYRAVDENLGVDVAVKENLFTTEEYARQFRLEAVILANLRQANLPRVTDHFVIGDQGQYLVMDYIEGEDLRQRMEREGMISEDDAVLIGAAMCDALSYLHSRKPPILHRDVKPGNVKITPDGEIYLVDFGLAKVVQGSQATTTGARAMTPGYSPPEQYGTARTDPRTDIYSLGATLYASLTGVIPEDGLARAMDNAQLTPIRKRNSRVTRRMASAIEKAMAIDSDDRFQSPDEFKSALLNTSSKTQRLKEYYVSPPPALNDADTVVDENGEERHSEPPPNAGVILPASLPSDLDPPTGFKRKRRRRKNGCWIPALLALLLVSVAIVAFVYHPVLNSMASHWYRQLASMSLLTNTPETVSIPTETHLPIDTATSSGVPGPQFTSTPQPTPTFLAGSGQIAFVSDRTGSPQLYLVNVDGTDLHPITAMDDGACQPSWSPDGQRLVFTSPCIGRDDFFVDTFLYIINADGTGLFMLPSEDGGDFEPDWSPDGEKILFTSKRDGHLQIYTINLGDQKVTRLTETPPDVQTRQPVWSPFGDQIAYMVIRYNDFQIWTMRNNGTNPEQFARSGLDFLDFLPTWAPDGQSVLFNQRTPDNAYKIWLMSLEYEKRGTSSTTKLDYRYTPIVDAEYSPDGNWLCFESRLDEDKRYDIYLMKTDGSKLTQLTTDPGVDFDPTWRPIVR